EDHAASHSCPSPGEVIRHRLRQTRIQIVVRSPKTFRVKSLTSLNPFPLASYSRHLSTHGFAGKPSRAHVPTPPGHSGTPTRYNRPDLGHPPGGGYRELLDTTMIVSLTLSRFTSANNVAAFAGCSLMQPCEAGPPRR